jgi:plasmid stability protein
MKNITLSVDDEVLAAVRRHAAEHDYSVNALVREYLTRLAAQRDRARLARVRLRQLSAQSRGRLGERTWSRKDLYDR